jgi:hypothetical protein
MKRPVLLSTCDRNDSKTIVGVGVVWQHANNHRFISTGQQRRFVAMDKTDSSSCKLIILVKDRTRPFRSTRIGDEVGVATIVVAVSLAFSFSL